MQIQVRNPTREDETIGAKKLAAIVGYPGRICEFPMVGSTKADADSHASQDVAAYGDNYALDIIRADARLTSVSES
jgi:hypothetical protein